MDQKFTDRMDVNYKISLYEYGYIRNPSNGKTLFCENWYVEHTKERPPKIIIFYISLSDVKEALEDVSEGFFSYLGDSKKTVLKNIDNECLTHLISCLNSYEGFFGRLL